MIEIKDSQGTLETFTSFDFMGRRSAKQDHVGLLFSQAVREFCCLTQ